jgi:hypothetical protein
MCPGPGEEGHDRSGPAEFIAVVEVIAARVVEVHGEFYQPQSQYAAIEVDVLLRVSGDRGDMVDSEDGFRSRRHGILGNNSMPGKA